MFVSIIFPDLPVMIERKRFWSTLFGTTQGFAVEIKFKLSVPEYIDLDIVSSNGFIKINGTNGEIHAVTTKSSIILENIAGTITAYTTNEKILAKVLALDGGNIELVTSNADIELHLPENVQTTVQAKAYRGKIKSEFPIRQFGPFTDQIQYGWINGGGVRTSLYTVNGTINIKKLR